MSHPTDNPNAKSGPEPLPPDERWFYDNGYSDGDRGPFNRTKIWELIEEGTIRPRTRVWKRGMAGWERADSAFSGADFGASPPEREEWPWPAALFSQRGR